MKNTSFSTTLYLVMGVIVLAFPFTAIAQKKSGHSDRHDTVVNNGEKAMGFSQTATNHHFLILKDGGAIQVEVNNPRDLGNRKKIRKHLTKIAQQFQAGIFTTPFAVHSQVPPGVPDMVRLKEKISYVFEETERGAVVRIVTKDTIALEAIHAFLRFQIKDHHTEDPLNN